MKNFEASLDFVMSKGSISFLQVYFFPVPSIFQNSLSGNSDVDSEKGLITFMCFVLE